MLPARRQTLAGVDTAVRELGDGPPLVLLHGVPTSGALYRDVMAPLAQRYRVIAPDLPGYGESDAGPDARIETLMDWARALVADLEQPVIAGVDLGGFLGMQLAVEGRASGLILSSTYLGPGWWPAVITALPPLDLAFYRLYGGRLWLRTGVSPDKVPTFESLHAGRVESDPDLVERMRETALSFQGLTRWPARLRASGVPVHVIWGTADQAFPPWAAKRIAAGQGTHVRWIEGGRHHLPFDAPQQWADHVLDALG